VSIDKDGQQYIMDLYMGRSRRWDEVLNEEQPQVIQEYADLLIKTGLIPSDERLSGFVLYSPSSNQRSIETEFARRIDACAGKLQLETPPMVITSDIFGRLEPAYTPSPNLKFISAYNGQMENFEHVKTGSFAALAGQTPLESHSVDLIWDRLGAMWHAIDSVSGTQNNAQEAVVPLLEEYKRILKKGGKVVIDAADRTIMAPTSTYLFSKGINQESNPSKVDPHFKVDFESLGWKVSFEGNGDTKIAVLEKKE